uniref:Uncharacterized protein n=2 Tax=Chlamydia pneumoniae TaxID=83558 RepID=A0A0F7XDD5_CHLPN|nr:hypothetical protein CWL029c_F_00300 [Chlamydia pneumoniae]CRI44123.1 hypothetical protein BN1224_H12_EY_00070 [Chlamydia pneumoniae]CRI47526.1 hypothetical protein BN1224_Panola_L_00300 [Chlamydia pneumoniae]
MNSKNVMFAVFQEIHTTYLSENIEISYSDLFILAKFQTEANIFLNFTWFGERSSAG